MMTMAKRILVPIDARERSETIVPIVAAVAHGSGSTVRLLRVFPVPDRVVGPRGRTIAYTDQEMARLTAEGMDQLRRIETQLDGTPVESGVRVGARRDATCCRRARPPRPQRGAAPRRAPGPQPG